LGQLVQNESLDTERLNLPDFHISSPTASAMKRPPETTTLRE
jgi:hypothetical protein